LSFSFAEQSLIWRENEIKALL